MSETSNIVLMKLARRREMEELAKGNLSDADIKRLQANNAGMKHEKLIKPLGTGATMQGDLVMHPKHGIVVRKSMAKAPRSVDRIRYAPDISIYQDIKEVQDRKGSMGFARVREVTPEGIVFQDLAEGKSILKERLEADEAFQKAKPKYDRATRKRERLVKKGLKTPADRKAYNAALKEQGAVYQDIRAGYDRAMAPLKDKEFDKSQRKFIKLLKKRWPGAWDYGAGQNVNKTPSGKMTMFDMSSGRGGPTLGSTGDTRFDQFRERAQGLHADAKPTRTNFFKNVSKIQRQKFISNAMPILVPLGTGAVTLGLMYGLNKLNNSLGKKKPMKKTASQIAETVLTKVAASTFEETSKQQGIELPEDKYTPEILDAMNRHEQDYRKYFDDMQAAREAEFGAAPKFPSRDFLKERTSPAALGTGGAIGGIGGLGLGIAGLKTLPSKWRGVAAPLAAVPGLVGAGVGMGAARSLDKALKEKKREEAMGPYNEARDAYRAKTRDWDKKYYDTNPIPDQEDYGISEKDFPYYQPVD